MSARMHVYENAFGEMIDHPDDGFTEIRCYDTTRDMTAQDFQRWLTPFADFVERLRRPAVLIDSTSFLMNLAFTDCAWRDPHIVPRYDAPESSGLRSKFPTGMPAVGAPPSIEGSASYPTAYFGSRKDATDWLRGENRHKSLRGGQLTVRSVPC